MIDKKKRYKNGATKVNRKHNNFKLHGNKLIAFRTSAFWRRRIRSHFCKPKLIRGYGVRIRTSQFPPL